MYTNISVLAGQDLPQDLGQNGYLMLTKRIENMSRAWETGEPESIKMHLLRSFLPEKKKP
jgi:hypothetical protein